jgi:hypothetical protein
MEARQNPLVPHGLFREKLQRHVLTKREVRGTVNLTHATSSEKSDDAIAAG